MADAVQSGQQPPPSPSTGDGNTTPLGNALQNAGVQGEIGPLASPPPTLVSANGGPPGHSLASSEVTADAMGAAPVTTVALTGHSPASPEVALQVAALAVPATVALTGHSLTSQEVTLAQQAGGGGTPRYCRAFSRGGFRPLSPCCWTWWCGCGHSRYPRGYRRPTRPQCSGI